MDLSPPRPGDVVQFAYLWQHEAERGLAEGKERPCVVVEVRADLGGGESLPRVTLLPVSTQRPLTGQTAVEIPPAAKQRLGLDTRPSWIVLDEANTFLWPGYDVRAARGKDGYRYGSLSAGAFRGLLAVIERVHAGAMPPLTDRDS